MSNRAAITSKLKWGLPLLAFLVLVVFFAVGLTKDPRKVPSPLIGKLAPGFDAPKLGPSNERFSPEGMRGRVWLLNVWASWCAACLQEHPLLLEMAKQRVAPIVGLNYKDQSEPAVAWLRRHGNPYDFSVTDAEGKIGIDFGVYGVPETFLIDQNGVIRYKHIGPITPEAFNQEIAPLIKQLQ